MFSSPINFVLFEDSNFCNMNCSYCDSWKERIGQPRELLSFEAMNSIYRFIIENGYRCEMLHLFTEPLLNFDNISKTLKANPYSENLSQVIYTNGLLLDTEKVNTLLRYGVIIMVSFDGLEQDIRCKDTFETVKSNIEKFPFCFGCSVTLHKLGIERAIKNLEFLLSLPIMSFALKPNTIYNWKEQEIQEYFSAFKNHFSDYELRRLGFETKGILATNKLSPQMRRENALYIKPNGDVYQHLQIWDLRYLGHYDNFEDKIQELSKINYYSEIFDCKSCPLKDFCSPHASPDLNYRIGEGSCGYRRALYKEFLKGEIGYE